MPEADVRPRHNSPRLKRPRQARQKRLRRCHAHPLVEPPDDGKVDPKAFQQGERLRFGRQRRGAPLRRDQAERIWAQEQNRRVESRLFRPLLDDAQNRLMSAVQSVKLAERENASAFHRRVCPEAVQDSHDAARRAASNGTMR